MNRIQLAQGCLLGDSAGASLEFLRRLPSKQELADALAMKGGGVLRVAPSQITDDGELILAMARADWCAAISTRKSDGKLSFMALKYPV